MNNLVFIDARDTKSLPLDASRYDESNKLCFIFLSLIDGETP